MAATSAVDPPKTKNDIKARHHLSSGALSGFSSAVCLQPLDLLKTRLQQGYEGQGSKRRKLGPVVREVLREDGVVGLWRGTLPTVVRNVPGVALYFYTLSSIRTRLAAAPAFSIPARIGESSTVPPSQQSGPSTLVRLNTSGNLMAGAIARTSVGFVLNPITVLKARYESNRYAEYQSLLSAFRSLLATSGVRGLFQGVTATAARDAPYAALSLTFYEKGKDLAFRLGNGKGGWGNALVYSGSGAGAAIMATLVTSPADVVKTRMQVNHAQNPTIRAAISRIYTLTPKEGPWAARLLLWLAPADISEGRFVRYSLDGVRGDVDFPAG